MAHSAIHPQVQAILDAEVAAQFPSCADMMPTQARDLLEARMAAQPPSTPLSIGRINDIIVRHDSSAIRVRRMQPTGDAQGRIIYFHGGGWVIGTLDSCDAICRALVAASGCEVWNVQYRLAPEHPFPAGLNDAYAVLTAAANSADAMPALFVAGDSAGGNLAAACALRARDTNGPKLNGQVLFYPVTDADLDRPSYHRYGDSALILTRREMAWFWSHYVGNPEARADPLASPLRAANLANLPPAFVVTASHDPLHDEGVAFANALRAAGTPVVWHDYEGMVHGFCSFLGFVDAAKQAVEAAGLWVKHSVGPGDLDKCIA